MQQPRSKVKKRSPLYVGSIQVLVRIPPAKYAELDAWIARQPEPKPTVPAAIRHLMDKALTCEAADLMAEDTLEVLRRDYEALRRRVEALEAAAEHLFGPDWAARTDRRRAEVLEAIEKLAKREN